MVKVIALDIDGTLFHTSKKIIEDSFSIDIEGKKRYVKIRPHINLLFEYLDSNKEHFNLIVYSAATLGYVNKLLEFIDTKGLIKEIYTREHCDLVYIDGSAKHIKNCKNINKNLHNLYLIDDSDLHFVNYDVIGYKCKKFIGEKEDNEIFNIIDFLNMLKII